MTVARRAAAAVSGAAARGLLLLALVGLGGCASLKGLFGTDAAAPASAASAAGGGGPTPGPSPGPSTPAPTRLEVDGPAPLRALLERNLDLARVDRLAGPGAIDETEWQRLIAATPAQVRELLQTEGYFEPRVILERQTAADGGPRVKLTLDPGPRTLVEQVTIEVEGELERAASRNEPYAERVLGDLRRSWALPESAPFRNPDWSAAKAGALARLRSAGWATAVWSGTGAEVDTERARAQLFVVADSGPLFRFGELQVDGLAAHDLETVRNLAGFAPGTPLSETALLDYQERLQKSGLFEGVNVTLDPDPERAAQARVNVRLREAALQVWTLGLGVSANTGPRASVEHTHRRLLGRPLTARNKAEWGRLRQSWDGEISTHPGEGFYRNLLGGAVERLESNSDIVLSQRVRLGRTQDMQRIERLYYVEAERSVRTTLAAPRAKTSTLAVSAHYQGVWRRLDSVVLPTEGYSLALQGGAGQSRGSDGITGPFTRLYGRLTGYLPLGGFGSAWYGTGRVELGQVIKRDDLTVPESQLFRAGGDESVRGYGYRSLGPLVNGAVAGGTTVFTASAELARPVSERLPSVWGAVFVDAGNAANSFNALEPVLGYGVGVRWRSPVGPLRLDWAYGRELKAGRIHFSVGIAL